MKIDIRASGFELTDALREHTELRLRFSLSWAGHTVRTVTVHLSDINGPRGGKDKRCRIQIPFAGGTSSVIEDTEADLYVAIDRAADRIEHTVARRLERSREHHHNRLDTGGTANVDPRIETSMA